MFSSFASHAPEVGAVSYSVVLSTHKLTIFDHNLFSYVIIYEKGYQETQTPYSAVTTKVKGTSWTNLTSTLKHSNFSLYDGMFVWDSSDYIIPPEVICLSSSTAFSTYM